MTDLQTSVGCPETDRLDDLTARRDDWRSFREDLASLEQVRVKPESTPDSEPSWCGLLMKVRAWAPFSCDELGCLLDLRRVQTRMRFADNLTLTLLADEAPACGGAAPDCVAGPLAQTDRVMERGFWIGGEPGLTVAMRADVVEVITASVRAQSSPSGARPSVLA